MIFFLASYKVYELSMAKLFFGLIILRFQAQARNNQETYYGLRFVDEGYEVQYLTNFADIFPGVT